MSRNDTQNRMLRLTGCGMVTPFSAGMRSDMDFGFPLGSHAAGPTSMRMIPDSVISTLPALPDELARDRTCRIAGGALVLAAKEAGITLPHNNPERVGLVLTNAQAGQRGMIRFAEEVREQTPRFVSPLHFPETVGNFLAGALARAFGLRGPNMTVCGGAEAGMEAFVEASELVGHGAADIVFVGGCETWTPGMNGWNTKEDWIPVEAACFWVVEKPGFPKSNSKEHIFLDCLLGDTYEEEPTVARVMVTGTSDGAKDMESRLGCCPSAGTGIAIAWALSNMPGERKFQILAHPQAKGAVVVEHTRGDDQQA